MPLIQATDARGDRVPYVFTKTGRDDAPASPTSKPPFYTRIKIAGTWTIRKLRGVTLSTARQEVALMRASQANALALGQADPLARRADPVTVADLIRTYRAAGCPDAHNQPAPADKRATIDTYLDNLSRYWARHTPPQNPPENNPRPITLAECDRFHTWRTTGPGRVKQGAGHRTVDLELTALSRLLTWAARADLATHNPIARRVTYQRPHDVTHCTDRMPADDDTLHRLAASMMTRPGSAVLGWQCLFEALTGCRTSEIVSLRMDAQSHGHTADPGYVDDRALWIRRSKHGMFPWILLQCAPDHSPLADLLRAHREWHGRTHPGSPWYFPTHGDPSKHTPARWLTTVLRRECPKLGIPHIASHGLRAYHVRVLRSLGIDDSEIAKRLGHRSGVQLVEKTYGVPEPGWFGRKVLDFLPENAPNAWAPWLPAEADNIARVSF